MKRHKKILIILFWEALENAPMLIGVLLAIRFQAQNLGLALICLFVGTTSGVIAIHFTESKKFSNQPSVKETLTNCVVFFVLGTVLIFYFSGHNVWWSNWVTDMLLGIVAGGMLAIGESWGWQTHDTVKTHILSMSLATACFLVGIRLIYNIDSLPIMLVVSMFFNIPISMLIVFFDYWPEKEIKQSFEKNNNVLNETRR